MRQSQPSYPIEKSNGHKQPKAPAQTKTNMTWLFFLEILSAKLWTQEVYWSIIQISIYRKGATIVLYNWNTTDVLSTNFPLPDHTQSHPWPSVWEHPRKTAFLYCQCPTCSFFVGRSTPKCYKHVWSILCLQECWSLSLLTGTWPTWHFIGFQEVLLHKLLTHMVTFH